MIEEYISKDIEMSEGSGRIYKNKIIHIDDDILCSGNLEFQQCVIYYNEPKRNGRIILSKRSKLSIRNSIVICVERKKPAFITGEGEHEIVLESSIFMDCSYFINLGEKLSQCNGLCMKKCVLHNCLNEFIYISSFHEGEKAEIINNIIIEDKNIIFQEEKYVSLISIEKEYKNESILSFEGNLIVEDRELMTKENLGHGNALDNSPEIHYLGWENRGWEVSNCTFVGLRSPLCISYVKDCKFQNCRGCIDTDRLKNKKAEISHCIFEKCTDVLEINNVGIISDCRFYSCINRLIHTSADTGGFIVRDCQFANIVNTKIQSPYRDMEFDGTCIHLSGRRKPNFIKNCSFYEIHMNMGYLIASSTDGDYAGGFKGFKSYQGEITWVQDCVFRNCTTLRKRKKIIREYVPYIGNITIYRKKFHENRVKHCKGLHHVTRAKEEVNALRDSEIKSVYEYC